MKMDSMPIVEHADGVVKEAPKQAGMETPHVESTAGLPSAADLDKVAAEQAAPATVPAPLEPAKPFDGAEYFKSLSMTAEAQEYFNTLQFKAAIFDKLNSNPVCKAFIDTAQKFI